MPQDCLLRTNWNRSALNNLHSLITPRLTLASILLPLSSEVQSPGFQRGAGSHCSPAGASLAKAGGTLSELGNRLSKGVRGLNLSITNNTLFLPQSYSAFPFINYIAKNFHVTGAGRYVHREWP